MSTDLLDASPRLAEGSAPEAIRERGTELVLLLFLGSGAAGLIYQVVWSRELVLLFGNTSQAISTIVTAFLFGLGAGALAGARLARGTRNPLRGYALLELCVAVLAAGLPSLLPLLGTVYAGAYSSLTPGTLALVRFALAFVAIVPATFAMGATLPMLTAHLVRSIDQAGARIGRLYAANTIGAVAGTILAGFVLIELLGLAETSFIAVGLNLAAATGAFLLSLRTGRHTAPRTALERDRESSLDTARRTTGERGRRAVIYAASLVSGFTALALEVLWNRLLAEGSGSSIYLFAAILAIYLFGIAVGSTLYARRASRPHGLPALGIALAVVGATAAATVALGSGPLGGGYYSIRPLLLLPATIAMGYAFPLSVRLLIGTAAEAAAGIGGLYAANTIGSVLGSFSAVFVMAGLFGTNTSILLLAALDLLAGAILVSTVAARSASRDIGRLASAGAMAVIAVALILAPLFNLPLTRTYTANRLLAAGNLADHREDVISTVDAAGGSPGQRLLYVAGVGMTTLTVDTKVMAYLPLLLRPHASRLLDICFGMGSTYRSALLLGLTADAVELSPTVPQEMGVFYPDAARYLHNPKGRVIVGDGRNYVRLSHESYDIIAVDPPPPIQSAGTVVLYTAEFLHEARLRLRPGGVFLLWVPYQDTLPEFREHVRTLTHEFPHVAMAFGPGGGGIYLMGSDQPMALDPAAVRQVLERPGALRDLNATPDGNPSWQAQDWIRALSSDWWLTDQRVRRFGGSGPMITDDHPLSEYYLINRMLSGADEYISTAGLRAAGSN